MLTKYAYSSLHPVILTNVYDNTYTLYNYVVRCAGVALAAACAVPAMAQASTTFQLIGLTELQTAAPSINGSGVHVAQVEASVSSTTLNAFEPNPAAVNTGVPFTFIDASGNISNTYNSADASGHAQTVGTLFYGSAGAGVAPDVASVAVYAESYYYDTLYADAAPINSSVGEAPAVVNQSFIYPGMSAGTSAYLDQVWDNYAAQYNTLFVSAIGDGQTTATTRPSYINPPADMYNGIAVGAYSGIGGTPSTWVGPTWDGRSAPDLIAPGSATSYTAPLVSGAAALLIQAGDENIGGAGTTAAATDIRTVKALLLNGAAKLPGWTNSYTVNSSTYTYLAASAATTTPLDPRYGAGMVNIYNSYENLAGGEHGYSAAASASVGGSATTVPAASFTGTRISALTGWNLASISASANANGVENYDFNLPGTSANSWDLTATLTWNKNYNASGINHLLLFLLNSSGQEVAESTNMVDNLQQINIDAGLGLATLAPGQYDLAVEMLGGGNLISTSDTYALAWNFIDPVSTPEPGAVVILLTGSMLALLKRKGRIYPT
ncbi:MAG: hypothetical protein ACP5VQ_05610 [Phycisphaerae bacterium]